MSNDDVGYGKPPKKSQFKKGQSGNPKGRPKGAKNLTGNGLELFHQPVPAISKGKATKIPAIDAIINRLLMDAIKGDTKSIKLALDQYAKLVGGTNSKSMTDLVAGQSPFELTPEDEANIAEFKLLEGVK